MQNFKSQPIIDYNIPTSQLFVHLLPAGEISNCKHVAMKEKTTIEHVLHEKTVQGYNI